MMDANELEFCAEAHISSTCLCGGKKSINHAFCGNCWNSLPLKMQNDLWKKEIGAGYEEAFIEATQHLQLYVW